MDIVLTHKIRRGGDLASFLSKWLAMTFYPNLL